MVGEGMGRKLNRRRVKKQRKIIVVSLIAFLFIMVGGYAAFQTNLNITAKGNIVDPSRVIQSFNMYDSYTLKDFHTDYYKENIISATFLDNNYVPSNAVESWDVSEDGKGGVMAWVIQNSEDNTKFDLYIGANGGVVANEDSLHLFSYFANLIEIEFNDNFDTSNAVDMSAMFYNCKSLVELDLSSFNTSKVTNFSALLSMYNYQNASSLTKVDLSGWDTRNVVDMRDMFAYNINLVEIVGIEDFNTGNVTSMHGVFFNNRKINNLDLSKWNSDKVTTMRGMFYNCQNITELNLCSFNTKNVTNMQAMVGSTINLNHIYVGDGWTMENVSNNSTMFAGSKVSSVTTGQCL